MLSDDGFVFGEVYAERPIGSHVGMLPLHARRQLGQRLIRLGGGGSELLALQRAKLGDLALNDELTHVALLLRGTRIAVPRGMKDENVKYLLQTAAVMAVLMVTLAAALVYLAPAA